MRQFRIESGSGVLQQLAESQETSLVLLLLLRVRLSNEFRCNYALRNHTVLRGHKDTRSVLRYTESNAVQTLDCEYRVRLLFGLCLSSKYSKEKGQLTVPKNKLRGVRPRRILQVCLRYFRKHCKVQLQNQDKGFQQDQTNSFGKYSYCRICAFEYGDLWGY
jgi:hypothetical protein